MKTKARLFLRLLTILLIVLSTGPTGKVSAQVYEPPLPPESNSQYTRPTEPPSRENCTPIDFNIDADPTLLATQPEFCCLDEFGWMWVYWDEAPMTSQFFGTSVIFEDVHSGEAFDKGFMYWGYSENAGSLTYWWYQWHEALPCGYYHIVRVSNGSNVNYGIVTENRYILNACVKVYLPAIRKR